MKRLWVLFLVLCMATLSCLSVLVPGAEEVNTEIWSIYSLKEDAEGNPYFDVSPSYEYNEGGLTVTPREGMDSYTVQTDHAYYMENGIYMEIKLDKPAEAGVLVFHLWDQNGILLSNFRCGSGWQGMIQLDTSDSQYMMSAYIQENMSDEKGYANILGSMKLRTPASDDGSVTYCIYLKDDILRVNGSIVVGADEALGLLRQARPDGSVYMGVSLVMGSKGGSIPITVARFGTSPENSVIPGTEGIFPETGEASTETIPPAPTETDPPADKETDTPSADTASDGDVTNPADGEPATKPSVGQDTDEPEEETTDNFNSPYEETESETRKDIQNDAVDSFMSKLENLHLPGCGSAVSAGCLGVMTLLAAAYIGLRKRH